MDYKEYKIAVNDLLALIDDIDIPYASLSLLCDPDPIYDSIKGENFESDIESWSEYLMKKLDDDDRWDKFDEGLFNLIQELNNGSTVNHLLTSMLPLVEMPLYRTYDLYQLEEKVSENKYSEKEKRRYDSLVQISEITNLLSNRFI